MILCIKLLPIRPQLNEARHRKLFDAAQSEESSEPLTSANQKPRHPDTESKGMSYEKEVHSAASVSASSKTHSPGTSSTANMTKCDTFSNFISPRVVTTAPPADLPESISKRKSPDSEPGLVEEDGRPGKKTRHHNDGDRVSDPRGRSAAAPPVTSTRQTEKPYAFR